MILKCVKAMDKYAVNDEITLKQLEDEGHPQCIIDYCFTAKPEPKREPVKLAIIEVDGRLGCWVPGDDYPTVLRQPGLPSMRRWLPLETIAGYAAFSHWADKNGEICGAAAASGRYFAGVNSPAGHAAFAVFAAKE
jgi:hypothetical protein